MDRDTNTQGCSSCDKIVPVDELNDDCICYSCLRNKEFYKSFESMVEQYEHAVNLISNANIKMKNIEQQVKEHRSMMSWINRNLSTDQKCKLFAFVNRDSTFMNRKGHNTEHKRADGFS